MKTALKETCMGKIEKWVDLKEEGMSYQELREEVMKYAMKKRTESAKTTNVQGMGVDAIISELNKLVDNITVDHCGQPGWGKGMGPVIEENENGTKKWQS